MTIEENGFEKKQHINFIFPSLKDEMGEIERVAKLYSPDNQEDFVQKFLEKAAKANLVYLTEYIWSKLENTDSYDIKTGGWDQIEEHVAHENEASGAQRDWQTLKSKMEQKQEINAPIILKYGNETHLVSGNTRLMDARALGEIPKVLYVEMEDER